MPGVSWDNPVLSLRTTRLLLSVLPMDLSTDHQLDQLRVDCERCGRRIGEYVIEWPSDRSPYYDPDDDADPFGFSIYEADRRWTRKPLTGRHRGRWVRGREGTLALFDGLEVETAFEIECGCGHKRTIGRNALRRRVERAPVERETVQGTIIAGSFEVTHRRIGL